MTNSADRTLESGRSVASSRVPDSDSPAWLWYIAVVTGILAGEFTAVHILGEPLLFHGVSMGISAGAFLLMAFNHDIPLYIEFSTWAMCAILTIAWTYHDTLQLRSEAKRIAVFCVIIVGFLLDIGISSAFASGGSSVRIVNLVVGVAMILGGIASFFDLEGHAVQSIVVGAYAIIFGAFVGFLEFQIPPQVSRYASFMFSFIGRGVFYIFVGSILFSGYWTHFVPGAIIGLTGVGYVALEFVPSIEPPVNMREADQGWGAEAA
ncbi:COPI associated protein-domain-containing protein [Xylariaceae sp. FL1651]|nr:COPI associated protein-domain-containing protein [Xylariaceae sp. FL1651]